MVAAGAVIAGRYRLESLLGQGGMGAVWRAIHLELKKPVALKLVLDVEPSSQAIERFLREAKSAASVSHRNVVDVIDFGRDDDGKPFLAMECLEGESLEARLRRSPAPTLEEIVEWVSAALAGLAAIHDAGIVHRDLKPPNVFLARDADGIVPKLLDFGIARPTTEASALTHTMQTLGTPHYMSHEQVRSAKTVDARSDVYAMGVILYQALAGRLPFDGPSATAVIAAIVTDDPTPLSELRPQLPPAVSEVVHRAIARDPKERFASARELKEALQLAMKGVSPGLAGKTAAPLASAATEIDPGATPLTPATRITAPRKTSRRGFFAMLGVLSTVLVAGLAGSSVFFSRSAEPSLRPIAAATPSGAPPTATATAIAETVSGGPTVPRGAMPGGTDEGGASTGLVLADFALRWRSLDPALREGVTVVRSGDRVWPLGPQASLDALDVHELPPSEGAELTPVLLASRLRANVRSRPHEESILLRTLPARGIVVGFVGSVDGTPSAAPGTEHAWIRVVVAEGLEGWVATGLLDTTSGCVPSLEAIGSPRTVLSHLRAGVDGDDADVITLFDPAGGGTLRIARTDMTCRLFDVGTYVERHGAIADYFLTRRTPEGDSLLLVGTWDEEGGPPVDGAETWRAYDLGDLRTSLWELVLHSGQNLPAARRDGIGGPVTTGPGGATGYWPVRIKLDGERTYYTWDGTTLIADPSLVNVVDTSGE